MDEKPPNNVEIKKIPSCRVAYVRTFGAAYSYDTVKPAFKRLADWAIPKGLIKQNTFLRGVAWSNPDLTPADKLIYDVCIEVPDDVKADKWVSVQTLPGGEYAVYRSLAEVRQHENQNEFMRLLYWLFFSDYRPDTPPYYNIYLNRAEDHPQGLADIDLCIPVVPLKMWQADSPVPVIEEGAIWQRCSTIIQEVCFNRAGDSHNIIDVKTRYPQIEAISETTANRVLGLPESCN